MTRALGLHSIRALSLLTLLSSTHAQALEPIIRPHVSVRSMAMGGTRYSTGLFDDNFYGNPARITANPKRRLLVAPDLMVETNWGGITTAAALLQGGDPISSIGTTAGTNIHARTQLTFPSYYFSATGERKWAFAIALMTSIQVDAILRRSYQANVQGIADIGPALTVGRKLLHNDLLSLGATGHFTYRLATNPNYGIVNFLQGQNILASGAAGEGAMVDVDAGATLKLPWAPEGWEVQLGGAVNNILGGGYDNIPLSILNLGALPVAQPRSGGVGLSFKRTKWGPMADILFAFEVTDIGNNSYGSFFRMLHLGVESRYGILVPRIGLNQGYPAGGLGIAMKYFHLDLAVTSEEMSYNSGGLQDLRFATRLMFKI